MIGKAFFFSSMADDYYHINKNVCCRVKTNITNIMLALPTFRADKIHKCR